MTLTIKGIIGAPPTAFTHENGVDGGTYQKLIDFLIRHGAHAIAMPMHVGESLNLSVEERRKLAELAVEAAGGRVPILPHTGLPGTDEVIALSRHAQSVGAAGVVVITPYYWQPQRAALVEHFVAVASALDIALVGYNSPQLGVSLTPDILEELIDRCPNFIGLKDASFDMEYFTEVCRVTREARPGFAVFAGMEYLLTSMPVGGAGCFSFYGVAPRLIKSLYEACLQRDYERALPLQYKVSQLRNVLRAGSPATVKFAMEVMGRPLGPTRRPLPSLSEDRKSQIRGQLKALGILETEPHGW
ncbi:MAG: dihydrodipicolinate synthase family protein [Burkholderiales bacterium]